MAANRGHSKFLAHQYLGVDLKLVWNIVEQHLPQLEQQIIEMARTEGADLNASDTPEPPGFLPGF